uniref:Groucho/TLE N-terminal Q-rich domain-containing protein n=1 Tax=Otus sunia TaxID=257818 RepID=A0A8C8B636_9STRI
MGEGLPSPRQLGRCQALRCRRPGARCDLAVLFQHQQQVLQAVERAKQVTVGELNSIVGVSHAARPRVQALSLPGRRPRGVRAVLGGILLPALPVSGAPPCPAAAPWGQGERQVLRMTDPAN